MTPQQQWAIFQAHQRWEAEQVAAGVDGPVPADRPSREKSDYNLHFADMEASGEALDDYFDRVDEILR